MATEVLAVAATVGQQSAELPHVEGTAKTYVLKGTGKVKLVFKDSAAALQDTGVVLESGFQNSVKLDCDGTYRWERVSGNCGVQQG